MKLETQRVIHLHFVGFMSIVEGQRKAEDTGDDTLSFCWVYHFMSIGEGQSEAGHRG